MVYEIFEAIQTLLAQSVMFHHLVMLLDPSLLEKEVLRLLYSVQSLGSEGDLVKNETILNHLHSSQITEVFHCIYVRFTSVEA